MKINIALRMFICVMLIMVLLSAFIACSRTSNENTGAQELEYTIEILRHEIERLEREADELEALIIRLENANGASDIISAAHTHVLRDCIYDCIELELPELWVEISGFDRFTLGYNPAQNAINAQEHIRVFENGNANVRLFPDGTFIANLFHNTKITGTYTEMTDGREVAVLFTYSGINNISGGVSSFESTGLTTVVGGIVDNVLTIPEDWDDGHGHGMAFTFRAYPLVFIGDDGQRIILHADSTFEASLANNVRIIGFYGIRATSITFVPGSPTFDRNGNPVGIFLFAELRVCGSDSADGSVQGDDDECAYTDDDMDIGQNSASYPTPSPASDSTPSPAQAPAPIQSPAPTPSSTQDPTPHPTEGLPTPTPNLTEDTAPPIADPPEDDENDNGNAGLVWCDECGEWHEG